MKDVARPAADAERRVAAADGQDDGAPAPADDGGLGAVDRDAVVVHVGEGAAVERRALADGVAVEGVGIRGEERGFRGSRRGGAALDGIAVEVPALARVFGDAEAGRALERRPVDPHRPAVLEEEVGRDVPAPRDGVADGQGETLPQRLLQREAEEAPVEALEGGELDVVGPALPLPRRRVEEVEPARSPARREEEVRIGEVVGIAVGDPDVEGLPVGADRLDPALGERHRIVPHRPAMDRHAVAVVETGPARRPVAAEEDGAGGLDGEALQPLEIERSLGARGAAPEAVGAGRDHGLARSLRVGLQHEGLEPGAVVGRHAGNNKADEDACRRKELPHGAQRSPSRRGLREGG